MEMICLILLFSVHIILFRSLITRIVMMRNISVNIVPDLRKPFLGNGSANTFQCATMEDVSQWTNVKSRC
jgi:hypothetical protein